MIGHVLWIALAILSLDFDSSPTRVVAALLSWQTSTVPATLQADVQREVSAIWSRLGIDVEWRTPRAGEPHVTVIVKDTNADAGAITPLGWVNFVDHAPSAVLYASADAAWNMVLLGRTETGRFADEPRAVQKTLAARLLGRAIAHELGHYLLGSREHATRGLMRPILYATESVTKAPEAYGLDRAQRQTLCQRMGLLGLYARAGAPPASGS